MTTVGEIIHNNPAFDEGVFANPFFYHQSLSEVDLTKEINQETLRKSEKLGISVKLLQNITYIAMLVIPSFSILNGRTIRLVGLIACIFKFYTLTKEDPSSESHGKMGIKQRVKSFNYSQVGKQHGRLVACLDTKQFNKWALAEVVQNLALKTLLCLYVIYSPIVIAKSCIAALIIRSFFDKILEIAIREIGQENLVENR